MRLEKSFGNWAREFRPIYGPYEAGLGRFVHLDKGDFIGREAAVAEKASGGERKLITLAVDAKDADAIGDEPIWHDGQCRGLGHVGWLRSHASASRSRSAMSRRRLPTRPTGFAVELIGEQRAAVRSAEALFDPKGLRMRA